MVQGRVFGTGHLERVEMNEFGETQREQLLNSLHQRIRYVHAGDDGFIYLLTDETDGALLKMEPGTRLSGPAANPGDNLFPDQDCGTCHRLQESFVGPSWMEIANRYDDGDAILDQLADRIIEGGGGAWGEVPMAPHTNLSVSEARDMAVTILGLD
jgi:cytochrome c